MSSTTSSTSVRQASLDACLARWKAKAGRVLDPMRQSLGKTSLQVLGVWELVQTQKKEYQDLVRRLTWITEQVLDRVPPDAGGDEATQQMVNALRLVTNQVDKFLRSQPLTPGSAVGGGSCDTVANLGKALDAVTLQFAAIHTVNVGLRLDELQMQNNASLASQGYAWIPRYGTMLRRPTPSSLLIADIPPEPVVFCGRDKLVKSIVRLLLQDRTCRIPLLGPGGMGKTSVAVAVINDTRVKTKYRQDIRFVSCEGLVSADGIVQALAASLGLQANSNPRKTLLQYLSSRACVLLVLDNLETAWDSEDKINVEQLLAKLAEISSLSLVITMRGAVRPAGVDWSEESTHLLRPLSLDAARQVWTRIARTTDSKLDQLLVRLDGLPLAITLMAHQGQLLSPTELLEAYTVEKTALIEEADGGRLTSLDVSIQLSLNSRTMSKSRDATALLSLLSLLPDGVSIAILRRSIPSIRNARKSASALLAVALASKEKDRIRALAPIRDFISTRYPPKDGPLREIRSYFAALTLKAYSIPKDRSKEALDMLSNEFGNITSIQLHFWSTPPLSDVDAGLVATLGLADFSRLTHYGDCLPLLHLAKTKLEHIGNRSGAARCTQILGELLNSHSRYGEAIQKLQEARTTFRRMGNLFLEAQCTRSIGDALRMLCRYTEAMANLEEAQAMFMLLGYRLGIAQCIDTIGRTLYLLHRHDEALAMLKMAKSMFVVLDDPWAEAQSAQGISTVLISLDRHDEAIAILEEVKPVLEKLGNKRGAAQCIHSMGDVLLTLGRYNEGITKLDEAKEAYAGIGDTLSVAQCTAHAGNLLRMLNQSDKALALVETAQRDFEAIGYPIGVAKCKKVRGHIFAEQDRKLEAETCFTDAMRMFQEMDMPQDVQRCRDALSALRAGHSTSSSSLSAECR
ncbi:TPR-like protein [Calocera viscosa TUFC12733]|uniref:TPR-like protein n=1 Tax=Calocera viscosa (strain TUFC12733) TaxID=1330018 RepID=A0A167K095_CALVF|nr:TPR-like protein [Calocera viscosa TUFC12733]